MKLFCSLILLLILSFLPSFADFKPSSKVSSLASIANLIEAADENYKAENYNEAISYYKKAFEKDSTNPLTHFGLGISYMAQEKYDLAVEHLLRSLELNPALLQAYFALACAYKASGQNASSLIAYRQGLGLDLNKPLPRSSFFNEVVLSNNLSEGSNEQLQTNQESFSLNENDTSLKIKEEKQIINLQAILNDQSDYLGKIEEYKKELLQNPSDIQLLQKLGFLYVKAKQIPEASQIYEQLQILEPSSSQDLKEAIDKASKLAS